MKNFIKKVRAWCAKWFRPRRSPSKIFAEELEPCELCDYKREFNKLMELPNCNDCGKAHGGCVYCPRVGGTIRINCPLWEPKKEAKP